jgi:hypothetical protein
LGVHSLLREWTLYLYEDPVLSHPGKAASKTSNTAFSTSSRLTCQQVEQPSPRR